MRIRTIWRGAKTHRIASAMAMPLRSVALAALLAASPAFADALVDNVNGMTLDKDGQVVRFNALLVSPDGKVVKLLQAKDKRP